VREFLKIEPFVQPIAKTQRTQKCTSPPSRGAFGLSEHNSFHSKTGSMSGKCHYIHVDFAVVCGPI
jgi:hypothetical protein